METLKILIVDDEPGIRSGIIRILKNFTVSYPFLEDDFDFILIEADTGEKAIEIVDNSNVDIILLDNKLPGIDGIDVLEYISEKQYDALVMMITSYASLDLAVKATNNGAYNFVPKPFTPQELKSAIEDITKRLYLKRMTHKMKKEGKEIRFQFLSVLSHELKSPINAIEGYLKIMQDKQVGDSIDDYKVMIDRSIERINGMRTLIFDLLDLTKLESGKKNREISKVDVVEVTKIVMATMEPLAIQKHVKMNLEGDKVCMIKSSREEVEIILNNLISNAVKYNKEKGEVFINVSNNNEFSKITIEDTGIGMSEEDQSKLFQDFVRIKNAKTKNVTGSGLGLSIAKKMIELNKGTITLESTPDVGTKFTVNLPIANIDNN
jgi:signal transduction histidine kinase